MQYDFTDEVARNGALSRITSARGFLERPLAFCNKTFLQQIPKKKSSED
jgi:hypothetical protein